MLITVGAVLYLTLMLLLAGLCRSAAGGDAALRRAAQLTWRERGDRPTPRAA